MAEVDVMDSTWIDVHPATVGDVLAQPANWARWWPGLHLVVDELRGAKGVRWCVPAGCGGTVRGSMEVWLQPVDDGTVAHYFLRLDGIGRPIGTRAAVKLEHEYRTRTKQAFWAVSERLDPGRLARVAGPSSDL